MIKNYFKLYLRSKTTLSSILLLISFITVQRSLPIIGDKIPEIGEILRTYASLFQPIDYRLLFTYNNFVYFIVPIFLLFIFTNINILSNVAYLIKFSNNRSKISRVFTSLSVTSLLFNLICLGFCQLFQTPGYNNLLELFYYFSLHSIGFITIALIIYALKMLFSNKTSILSYVFGYAIIYFDMSQLSRERMINFILRETIYAEKFINEVSFFPILLSTIKLVIVLIVIFLSLQIKSFYGRKEYE